MPALRLHAGRFQEGRPPGLLAVLQATFADGLETLLKSMHKGHKHVGKVPVALRQSRDLSDRLKQLQKKLDKAVTRRISSRPPVARRDQVTKDQITQLAMSEMTIHEFLSPPAETPGAPGRTTGSSCPAGCGWRGICGGWRFPAGPKSPNGSRCWRSIRPAVESLPQLADAFSESMDNLSALDKQILVERHLISREHAAKSAGSGLVLNKEESLCVMINEEDHLRMQALRPGLQLAPGLDGHRPGRFRTGEKLDYAFSPNWVT
jgi:hypothetical protein